MQEQKLKHMTQFVVGAGAYMLGLFGDLHDEEWMDDYDHPPDILTQEDAFFLTETEFRKNFRLAIAELKVSSIFLKITERTMTFPSKQVQIL